MARPALRVLGATAIAVALLAAAFVLGAAGAPIVSFTSAAWYAPFELGGAAGAAILLGWLALVDRRRRRLALAWDDVLPALCAIGVGLLYLGYLAEHAAPPSWDYTCYEDAARALVAGRNPYLSGCYWYPPITAEALAALFRATAPLAALVPGAPAEQTRWMATLYFYQCAQLALIVVAVRLSIRIAERLGVPRRRAALACAVLFAINAPVLRTLRHDQVDLWLLDLVLVALATYERWPYLAGAAIAVATHVKLYPVLLLLPFVATRRWRVVAGGAIGLCGVLAIQMAAGAGPAWAQYAVNMSRFPMGTHIRDCGPHALAYNTLRVGALAFGSGASDAWLMRAAGWAYRAAAAVAFAVLGARIWRRERAGAGDANGRLHAHAADALALMLLVSPKVWEHHYVFAIPIAIVALARLPEGDRRRLAVSALLMFAVPAFDLYPLSYHRLAGLLLLLPKLR